MWCFFPEGKKEMEKEMETSQYQNQSTKPRVSEPGLHMQLNKVVSGSKKVGCTKHFGLQVEESFF